jgi:threonyl-tRNA synthetase
MPTITLPDGSQKSFDHPVSVLQVAENIGPGLLKATLAGVVNDALVDASHVMDEDATLSIITGRDEAGVEIMRHSCAHLLAQAVQALFPKAQVTIGPVIDDGFYYDFAYEPGFTPEDLVKIEAKMKELAKADYPLSRVTMTRDEAIAHFEKLGELYKVELIKAIPEDQTLSLYKQDDFMDLCRGPHVPSTAKTGVFKLTKLAGAYWRGDAKNAMLQRIYGTCWPDKKALKDYLFRIEEAEKRDHRKLGKALHFYHMQDNAPGMVFWHEKGWQLYLTIEQYFREKQNAYGFTEIKTPMIVGRSLWEKSGHWEKFANEMFTVTSEDRDFAIKPMNCPCHIQVFNQGLKSYRDLPIRLAEFGAVHRDEPSGALHGLMRVRGFCQDDAHIFCTEAQVKDEITLCNDLIYNVYKDFGFENVQVCLATRPENRIGDDAAWDKAEVALAEALSDRGIEYKTLPGEGAFYGPKIEFHLTDCLGRSWQLGTVQLDFSMPGRLDAQYVSEDSSRQTPIMIHRAVFGSLERFIAILIEHYAGKLPFWLSPVQAVVLNITDRQSEYAAKMVDLLKKHGIRAKYDLRNEKIGYKIREHTLQRVPYLLVVGDKEEADNTVAVRTMAGDDLGVMPLDQWLESVKTEE